MSATQVDWSMGSPSSRLADWDTALQIARKLAGPGVRVPAADRARMREDFAELVPRAEELILAQTGMTVTGFRSRAWVMARSEWIRANLTGLQRLLEPLAERLLAGKTGNRGEFKRKAMGAQAGALFGYVAQAGTWPVRRVPASRRRRVALLRRPQRRRGRAPIRASAAGLPAVGGDPRGDPPGAVRRRAVASRSPPRARRSVPAGHLARLPAS